MNSPRLEKIIIYATNPDTKEIFEEEIFRPKTQILEEDSDIFRWRPIKQRPQIYSPNGIQRPLIDKTNITWITNKQYPFHEYEEQSILSRTESIRSQIPKIETTSHTRNFNTNTNNQPFANSKEPDYNSEFATEVLGLFSPRETKHGFNSLEDDYLEILLEILIM